MLALRASCSTLRAAARQPRLISKYSGLSNSSIDLINDLRAASNDPPVAPPGSYPAGQNPFKIVEDSKRRAVAEVKLVYHLHCHSTRNNTITTFTKPDGGTIAWFSGGSVGFKGVHRAGYEAGYQCAVRMFKRIEEHAAKEPMELALYFKGFGQGRDALQSALTTSEGEKLRPMVVSITDRTPIKIGGTRAKKARRL